MRRALLLVLLVALLAPAPARAGPWMPGRWHFHALLRQSALFAGERFDARGDRRPIRIALDDAGTTAPSSYVEPLTSLFFELGVAARLSLLADFRALHAVVRPGTPGRTAVGPSDLWLAAKLLLFDDELAAAMIAAVTVPIGSSTAVEPLGQGDLRAEMVLLLGKLFERPSVFVSGEVGLRLRSFAEVRDAARPSATTTVQYSHVLRFAGAAGYTWSLGRRLVEWLTFALKFEGEYAFDAPVEDGLGLLVPRAASFLKLGTEVTWAPRRWLQLTLGAHGFVAGRATPAYGEVALGIGFAR